MKYPKEYLDEIKTRLKVFLLLFEMVPFGAPLSLIKLVKLLVSNPVIPTILFFFNQISNFFKDL